MILDSARDSRIFGLLLESYLEHVCLYSGFIPKALEAAAPYLVQLEYEDRRSRRLLDLAWGNSWGVFLKCDTTVDPLRRNLRRFLIARDPAGQRTLFRYYDPRVLRLYLPSCSGEELRTVFGPIETFWAEDENPGVLLRFELDSSRLVSNQLSLGSPAAPPPSARNLNSVETVRQRPGLLAIRRDQWGAFSEAEIRKFEDWMVSHLQKFFPRQCSNMGESKIREIIQYGTARARSYGITVKREVCQYIDLMVVLGRDFDQPKKCAWAHEILAKRKPPTVRIRSLMAAAKIRLRSR